MAWFTTKQGKHVNTDWFDKERQIQANKEEADKRNNDISNLSKMTYEGTKDWFRKNSNYDSWSEEMEETEYYDSIYKYTGEFSNPINHYLRSGEFKSHNKYYEKEDMKEDIEELDKAIDAFDLKRPITVYRKGYSNLLGADKMSYEQIRAMTGKSVIEKAYTSASTVKELPGEQTVHGNMMYVIDVPSGRGNGAYIVSHSENPREREFLIKRNATYSITRVTQDDDGIIFVYMKMGK